jgi:hypothetical protein
MPLIATETIRLGDWLKFELDSRYNRETGSVIADASNNLISGAVMGRITASGLLTLHNAAASDGSQNAIGVLVFDVDARVAAQPAVIVARGPAMVGTGGLNFRAGITAPQRTAALAALTALGIVTRATV